uniref:F-box domain-containing protein n=1 Tax=Theileria annulata TaxID=5874 RepID=A0A3B0MGS0_THEAN
MENALERFISLAPKDVIALLCNFLDFSEFLSLSSASRPIRAALVNHHLFWFNYYTKNVHCRTYNDKNVELNGVERSSNKYQLKMPIIDNITKGTDPMSRLLNSARKVEIMKSNNTISSNPMLNLGILDNFKRSRWKGQFKQYVEQLSKIIGINSLNSAMIVHSLGSNPFLIISSQFNPISPVYNRYNTTNKQYNNMYNGYQSVYSICGYDTNEDKLICSNVNVALKDIRYEVKLCTWLRFDDSSYSPDSSIRSMSTRLGYVPKVLVILCDTSSGVGRSNKQKVKSGKGKIVALFYYYDEDSGFINIPSMTLKMYINHITTDATPKSIGVDAVSSLDVYGSLGYWDGREIIFRNLNLFVGTVSGVIYHRAVENNFIALETSERITTHEITSLRYVFSQGKSILIVFSYNRFLGLVDVSTYTWHLMDCVNDSVVAFSVDISNCLLGYSLGHSNKVNFIDFYNFTNKAQYLVPKPPTALLALERHSKWAVIIKNYIRILIIEFGTDSTNGVNGTNNCLINNCDSVNVPNKGDLRIKSVSTLNGHVGEIRECVHDGWSKLVTIDTLHNLFVWDYTACCKIFSFSLVSDFDKSFNHCYYGQDSGPETPHNGYNTPNSVYTNSRYRSNTVYVSVRNTPVQNTSRNTPVYNSTGDNVSTGRESGRVEYKISLNVINKLGSKPEVKDAIDDYLYSYDSDPDASPYSVKVDKTPPRGVKYKNAVPASNIKGLLDPNKKGQKYSVDVSVHSLVIYYQSCNVLQVFSFK